MALAAVPSSLMLSVTTYISTDIAAIPLMWIVPLLLYLLQTQPDASTGATLLQEAQIQSPENLSVLTMPATD